VRFLFHDEGDARVRMALYLSALHGGPGFAQDAARDARQAVDALDLLPL